MNIAQIIKGNIAFALSKAVKKKVDGKLIGQDLDKKLDQNLGSKASEKIQRGPLTDIVLDILEGLWEENPDSLAFQLRHRADIINKQKGAKDV